MNNKRKKSSFFGVAMLALLVSIVFFSVSVEAAKRPALAQQKISIGVGETTTIKLKNVAKSDKISYKSSAKKIATVTNKGKITGKKVGNTNVVVSVKNASGTKKLTCKVQVKKPELTNKNISLEVGKETNLVLKYVSKKAKVAWTSSNANVASVDKKGHIKAVSAGTANISGTVKIGKNKFKLSCMVVVVAGKTTPNMQPPKQAANHTVTFDSMGGTPVSAQIVADNAVATMPAEPTYEGYFFAGWYTSQTGGQRYLFSTPVTSDIRLYAQWVSTYVTPPQIGESQIPSGTDSTVETYAVANLSIDPEKNVAAANVSAPENCALIVRFIDEEVYFSEQYPENKTYIGYDGEENYSLYASHVVRAQTDLTDVYADIQGELPQYYVAEAVLVNDNFENLCEVYTDIQHTARYEEFAQKSVDDFDENEVVVNFDEQQTDNFGVLSEDVKIIQVTSLTRDEETDIYCVKGLESQVILEGDKLYVSDGENEALIRVSSISIEEDGAYITAAKADDEQFGFDLEDFYSFIKVDMDFEGDAASENDESSENDPENVELSAENVEVVDTNVTASANLSLNLITFETTHFRVTGKISGKVTASLVMQWDVHLFGADYMKCDFTVSTDLSANVAFVGKWGTENNEEIQQKLKDLKEDKELKLGKVRIPFGVTGLDAFASVDVLLNWQITAGVEATGSIKTTSGFKYNTKDGKQDIDKKEITWSVDIKGHGEISFGPKPSVGVEFLKGVVSAGVEAFFGAKAEANAVIPTVRGGSSIHGCNLCIDGNVKRVISVNIRLKYKINKHIKGTPFDFCLLNIENKMFDFYVSLINPADSMFGGKVHFDKGSCPNKAYKTTFYIQKPDGTQHDNTVTVHQQKDSSKIVCAVPTGKAQYIFPGTYVAKSDIDLAGVSKSFAVVDKEQIVTISSQATDGKIIGMVKDAKTGNGIESAEIEVYCGSANVGSARTDGAGQYEISLPEGEYKYVIKAKNYISYTGYCTLGNGEQQYIEKSLMVGNDNDAIMGGIFGQIKDAKTGEGLSGVKIYIYEGANNEHENAPVFDLPLITDSDGNFSRLQKSILGIKFGINAGNYTIKLMKEGYISTSYNVTIVGGENVVANSTMAPISMAGTYRVVLRWGQEPDDLDSHLIARTLSGDVEHVYYSGMYGYTAELDTDDTSSYGPETIYIQNLGGLSNGFYYCVHDYSNAGNGSSTELGNSGAVVEVYKEAMLLKRYNVPVGAAGTVWNVFFMDTNGNLRDINTMDNEADDYYVGRPFIDPTYTYNSNDSYDEDDVESEYASGNKKVKGY